MRRLSILVVMILFSGLIATLPGSEALGQSSSECTIRTDNTQLFLAWECVEKPEIVSSVFTPSNQLTAAGNKKLQTYDVKFNGINAAIPIVENAEFMIVTVVKGDFSLESAVPVGEDEHQNERALIIDPTPGESVPVLQRIAYEPDPGPYFKDTGEVLLLDGGNDPCQDMCALPDGFAVQVKTGDTIYALDGALCIWCLLNSRSENQGAPYGELVVSALVDADAGAERFSWIERWNEAKKIADESASTGSDPSRGMIGWALFNPNTGCRGH